MEMFFSGSKVSLEKTVTLLRQGTSLGGGEGSSFLRRKDLEGHAKAKVSLNQRKIRRMKDKDGAPPLV